MSCSHREQGYIFTKSTYFAGRVNAGFTEVHPFKKRVKCQSAQEVFYFVQNDCLRLSFFFFSSND